MVLQTSGTGEIAGVITDSEDNAVDGVDLTFTDTESGSVEEQKTVDGAYLVELPAGTYDVAAQANDEEATNTVTVSDDGRHVSHLTLGGDDTGDVISYYDDGDGTISDGEVFDAVQDWQEDKGFFADLDDSESNNAIFEIVQAWQEDNS
jgi:hypothetical protein